MPNAVVAYVEAQDPNRGFYRAYTLVTFAILLLGLFVGSLFWAPLEELTDRTAIAHAHRVVGLMVHTNFGLSGVLAMFAWIVTSGALANLTIIGERRRAAYFAFTVSSAQTPWMRFLIARSLKRVAPLSGDPEAYVHRWIDHGNRQLIVAALIGVVVSCYTISRDVSAHTVYTADAYIRAPFFPWASTEPRAWRATERVELGCNHVTGKNASDYIVYRVSFRDGSSVSLENAVPLPGMDWLAVAEGIDAQIRAGGARFERWRMDRDPLHPACLAVMQRNFGSDYPRVERLLRIGELPDR